MRLIDADVLPRHGNRGGLVNWYDIEKAPTVNPWEVVYDELTKISLLCGRYNAKHATDHYMYGVSLVMESIAYRAGKQDEFNEMFYANMTESEERAERAKE